MNAGGNNLAARWLVTEGGWRRWWLSSCFQSLMTTRAWASDQKLLMLRHSSRIRELKDST